eukprot:scaffold4201_cov76-Skeletonema_dohrnii-CCMP3373.AAC.3
MSESGNNNHRRQPSESSLSDELLEFCKSDDLSEEGLREIIERHGLTPNHNVGDYQFFLWVCNNERVTESIIRYLLNLFPDAVSDADEHGQQPLHFAFENKNVTPNIVQLLIDAAPDSVRSVDEDGWMPLHYLCSCNKEDGAIEILMLLIERHPEAIRHVDNYGHLPIHLAAACGRRSPEFCRELIEAYPESERIGAMYGMLPFHLGCRNNTIATVEYLYKRCPDAICHVADGFYPIHYTIMGMGGRDDPLAAVDIVQFLLDCDSAVKLQTIEEESLLYFACMWNYTDSNIDVALEMIKVIYDANPEAIEDDRIASNIHRYHQQVESFLNGELVYSRQAKNFRQMMTPDGNGRLPLHTALQHNVRLGSIKLLVKGNPSAIRTVDTNFALPLHVACQHHDSASVVQYLLGLDMRTLRAVDYDNSTALHYACRGAKYENIALLLEEYDAVSVSKQNAHGKLPIDLLWESSAVEDRESIEYTESVFRLLTAYPETLMNCNGNMKQQGTSDRCSTQNGKKRKLCAV